MTPEKLYSMGYHVIPIMPYSKVPGFEGWQTADISKLIAAGWPSDKHGMGLRTGHDGFLILDMDAYDSEMIDSLWSYIKRNISPNCVYRVGQAPKIAIPVVCHEIINKIISKRFRNPANNTVNAIEGLSQGQQIVCEGIHPDTLMPYIWPVGDLPPLNELPVITLQQVQALFSFFENMAICLGWEEIVTLPSVNRKKQTNQEYIYNKYFNVEQLLEQYGWTPAGTGRWTRPGKTSGVSGTVTENTFYCFTSSSMLEPDQNHRPYDIVLAHVFKGDEEAMAPHVIEIVNKHAEQVFIKPPINAVILPETSVIADVIMTAESQITTRENHQFLPPQNQIEYFKNCVYVNDCDKIMLPNGVMNSQSQFNAMYGGYQFALDPDLDKTVTDAWKVFTNSQAVNFPKVDHTCFFPQHDFATIHTDTLGHKQVNTYIPAIVKSTPGDVTPYTDHLKKMIPNDRDELILLSYMAACVQYPGVKFQWGPLVQGVQGNGKSLLTRCLKKAIGERYCHSPNPADISNKFNTWIEGNLLIVIEEIAVAGKWEIMEILKPMITQRTLEIQGKGKDQRIAYICANFFFNSNHKDALIKTCDDRRYCPFFTAQQSLDDMIRDGMTDAYFHELYNWLKTGGYANVTHYLQNFEIPDEFNPSGVCQRAPETSSTAEAITFSLGPLEQEIMASVEQEIPGFMGGWISTMAIDKLMTKKNIRKPRNKRKQMMLDIGYIPHPGLYEGRATIKNLIDGGKPRLYVKKGHINNHLQGGQIICGAYIEAQGLMTTGTPAPVTI